MNRAPRWIALAVITLAAPPTDAHGQTRAEPRLLISLFGGVSGSRNLWEVNRQPLLVLGTELAPLYDTLRLSRRMKAGVLLGISGTVFQSARGGISAEMVFLGLGTEDGCTLTYESPGADAAHRNAQVCGSISSKSATPNTVAFSAGATFRPVPQAFIGPYARVQAGLALRSGSVIDMVGSFVEGSIREQRQVINDVSTGRMSPSVGFAGGLMTPMGPGYQLRLEFRDQIVFMRRVSGPADGLNQAIAPTEGFLFHNVSLTAGLDIVLEQKRGRRY